MGARRVEFRGVSKTFRMRNRSDALRDAIPRFFARLAGRAAKEAASRFVALDDVSFHVDEGEVLGLIGMNGAGKSTALRIAAGIYRPESGTVTVGGRVSALIELSAGFHPDLSGRENIYLVGALQGLRRREVDAVMDRVVAFADIGEFLESPVRTYSTGMAVRLGFAVAAHVPAAVLLVDEVLSVGDIEFQTKCLRRMAEVREQGVSILFVSHNLQVVEQFCDRVIVLHHGRVLRESSPREAVLAFRGLLSNDRNREMIRESQTPRIRRGTGEVLLEDIRLEGGAGEQPGATPYGGPMRVTGRWKASGKVVDPAIFVSIHSIFDLLLEESSVGAVGEALGTLRGEGTFSVEFPSLSLLPGVYEVSVRAADARGLVAYDFHQRMYTLTILGPGPSGETGLVGLAPRWTISRKEG